MKTTCYFGIGFLGDGSSTSKTVLFATGAFVVGGLVGPGSAPQMSPGFTLGTTNPSGVTVVSSSDGQTVTASCSLGSVTFTFPIAIPSGDRVGVYGYFDF
jgi:hypothetical protein